MTVMSTPAWKPHGRGMMQDVRCDFLAGQRRAGPLCCDGVAGESLFQGVSAHRSAAVGREQWVVGFCLAFGDPGPQSGDRVGGEWCDAVFSALSRGS